MNGKNWSLVIALLSLICIASTASAAITVSDLNLSCSPVNSNNGNCYKYSVITVAFKVIDSNVISASADGNTFNWVLSVYRGTNGEYGKGVGGTAVLTDLNLQSYCSKTNVAGRTDYNFNTGHNCSVSFGPISTLPNGTNGIDLNVSTYTGATWTRSNADDNASVEFTVNNALTSSLVNSLLYLIPLVIGIMGIIVIWNFKEGEIPLVPTIGLILALVIIGYVLMILSG